MLQNECNQLRLKETHILNTHIVIMSTAYQVLEKIAWICKKKSQTRAPDKSAYWKTIFFISHPKHMLWVLKRTV